MVRKLVSIVPIDDSYNIYIYIRGGVPEIYGPQCGNVGPTGKCVSYTSRSIQIFVIIIINASLSAHSTVRRQRSGKRNELRRCLFRN